MMRGLAGLVVGIALTGASRAEVKLATVFSDHMVLQRGVPLPVWGWAKPGEVVTVVLDEATRTATAGANGRWEVRFEPMQAGGPYAMAVTGTNVILVKDILVGEVWLGSGQSNMDFTLAAEDRYWCGVVNEQTEVEGANYPEMRMFKVKLKMTDSPEPDVVGEWKVTTPETVKKYSAIGYFTSRELWRKLHVPIGFIDASYGASTVEAWISPEAMQTKADYKYLLDGYAKARAEYKPRDAAEEKAHDEARVKWAQQAAKDLSEGKFEARGPNGPGRPDPGQNQHNPSVLYNGMIAPLIPYAIKGAVWYQGESNEDAKSVVIYRSMMETMVADWRKRWGEGDFPFVYVQLAALGAPEVNPEGKAGIARLREAQRQNLSIPNSGMAVTIDIGDEGNVHPKNKQEAGRRIGLIERRLAYGEDVVDAGPMYDGFKVEGSAVRVHFVSAAGVQAKGGKPVGFAIAGADRKWVWATGKVEGNDVVVSNPAVAEPVAVRYGYADYPVVNLYGKGEAGLPASPFRSDDW